MEDHVDPCPYVHGAPVSTPGRGLRLRAFAAVLLGAVIVSPVEVVPVMASERPRAERVLLGRLPAGVTVHRDARTGEVRHLGGSSRRPVWTPPGGRALAPQTAARRFLREYGSLFGVASPGRDLQLTRTRPTGDRTFVRFGQRVDGFPVLGGELVLQIGPGGEVISARGETSAGLLAGTRARVGADAARRTAIADARRRAGGRVAGIRAGRPVLRVFDPAVMGGPGLPVARLAWQVPVATTDGSFAQLSLVDAVRGGVLARIDRQPGAGMRICDQRGDRVDDGEFGDRFPCDPGDGVANPTLSLIDDVRVAALAARSTLDLYERLFGRDGISGTGDPAIVTVRYCPALYDPCPFANAFFDLVNGQAVLGTGYAVDDVVAHELTHGVVEAESGLFYYSESGAINESFADVFGEVIDQATALGADGTANRWLIGEDLPGGAIRSLADPERFGHPARVGSASWKIGPNDRFGVHSNSGVGNKTAWLVAQGGLFNGRSVTGLGRATMLAIWYRALQHLGSASDYGDFADILEQSCRDLIGTTPTELDGTPVARGAVRAADCTQVKRAALATEMRAAPTWGSSNPRLCRGATADIVLDEVFQDNDPDWETLGGQPNWLSDSVYAKSPPFHVVVPSVSTPRDMILRLKDRFRVPEGRPAFLAFQHAYDLQWPRDGASPEAAVVEITRGRVLDQWHDLGPTMSFNGYDGVVELGTGNVLQGRRTFAGASHGYRMTKVNLTHLAGTLNRIRFRMATNEEWQGFAWFLDDVTVYSCRDNGDDTPPTVSAPSYRLLTGPLGSPTQPVPVRVTTTVSDPSGSARIEWQVRSGSGAWAANAQTDWSRTTWDLWVTPSAALRRDRVRSEDEQGNLSGWRSASAYVRLFQETSTSPEVRRTGAWSSIAEAGASGGTVIAASQAGRSAAITVPRATGLGWVATKGPDRGRATVMVDGVIKATIDLWAPEVEPARIVYATSFSGTRSHTISVSATGRKQKRSTGTKVTVDGFVAITAP